MPIAAADLKTVYSGGNGNTSAAASLGGIIASTSGATGVFTDSANNLFDDVSGAESVSGDTEYRGFYIRNDHATLTLQNPAYKITVQTTHAFTSFEIAIATEAVNATMATIANESTAPAGVTWTSVVDNPLAFANLAPAARKGLWIKRIVTAGATAASDSGTIRVEGETAA